MILNQDKDRVIMLINYFIEKGEQQPQEQVVAKSATTQKQSRYDGFWDFWKGAV